jgi:hypothetical protein
MDVIINSWPFANDLALSTSLEPFLDVSAATVLDATSKFSCPERPGCPGVQRRWPALSVAKQVRDAIDLHQQVICLCWELCGSTFVQQFLSHPSLSLKARWAKCEKEASLRIRNSVRWQSHLHNVFGGTAASRVVSRIRYNSSITDTPEPAHAKQWG